MLPKLALVLFLAAAADTPTPAPAPAPAPMAKPGSFGFNWLDPNSQCKELTAEDVATISTCEASDNAFGLESKSLACKVNDKVELVVYDTAALCQEGLETMQANGD